MSERYSSVWEVISDTQEEAEDLRRGAEIMREIAKTIRANKWSKNKASKQCGISTEQITYLLNGWLSEFSTNELITILETLKRNMAEQSKSILGISPTLQPAYN